MTETIATTGLGMTDWVSNLTHVPRPITAKVLSVRNKHWKNLLDSKTNATEQEQVMAQGIVALFEMHAMRIENIHSGHVVKTFNRDLTKLVPAQGDRRPEITIMERYGRVFQNLLRTWFDEGYCASVLFFEPDATVKVAVTAWKFTGMKPESTGSDEVKRDLTTVAAAVQYTIPFSFNTCYHDVDTTAQGQAIVDEMYLTNANPNLAPLFEKKE